MQYASARASEQNVNFSELCRICVKKGKNFVHLFHTKRKKRTMADMFGICLQSDVHLNDGRPTIICSTCIPKLLNAFKLFQTAKTSEEFFQLIISSGMTKSADYTKLLVKSEFDETIKDPLAGSEIKEEPTASAVDVKTEDAGEFSPNELKAIPIEIRLDEAKP